MKCLDINISLHDGMKKLAKAKGCFVSTLYNIAIEGYLLAQQKAGMNPPLETDPPETGQRSALEHIIQDLHNMNPMTISHGFIKTLCQSHGYSSPKTADHVWEALIPMGYIGVGTSKTENAKNLRWLK